MKSHVLPKARHDNVVIQELHDEILVYDLKANRAFCLNKTSKLVWQASDGTKSVPEISHALSKKLGAPVTEDVVWMALNQFKSNNLLSDARELVTPFDGVSRRHAIKSVGLASVVALPVVSSLVAPTALHAQSGNCSPVGSCTFGSTSLCVCLPIAPVGNNSNPNGCPCATDGDCSGDCSGGVCVGGISAPICIPGDTSNRNPDCCPCSNVEGCANCCNDGVCGPCIG